MNVQRLVIPATFSALISVASCQTSPPPAPTSSPLVYERSVYFPGLGEHLTIVKTPNRVLAVHEDGVAEPLTLAKKRNAQAYIQKYGTFDAKLHDELVAAPPEQVFRAVLVMDPPVDWEHLRPRLFFGDDEQKRAARAELDDAVRRGIEALAADLAARGIATSSPMTALPFAHVRGAAGTLLTALKHHPALRTVLPSHVFEPKRHSCEIAGVNKATNFDCEVDGQVHHAIDDAFNQENLEDGYFGEGQRVGVYEDVGNCLINEDHEAFANAPPIVYSNGGDLDDTCNQVYEIDNFISSHGTAVASLVNASFLNSPCGAAKSQLYYFNSGETQWFNFPAEGFYTCCEEVVTSICHPDVQIAAYDWYHSFEGEWQFAAINESWGCLNDGITCSWEDARTWEGLVQDYAAQYWDFAVVKAGGNENCKFVNPPYDVGQHPACPFTLNSICVGNSNPTGGMAPSSSYANSTIVGSTSYYITDREEPDFVASGGETGANSVCAAASDDANAWRPFGGTSAAAPIVTSMIALHREKCEPIWGHRIPQYQLRALLRTAAFADNAADTAYSTPRPNEDFKDGAGVLNAIPLSMCEPDEQTVVGDPIDLSDPTDPPIGGVEYYPSYAPGGETQEFDYDPDDGQRAGWLLFDANLVAGQRFRATLSWNACLPRAESLPSGEAPATAALDLDLFLYNATTGEYVWGSQSVDDVNEGFDYTIPAGQGGHYQIWAVTEQGAVGCNNNTGPVASAFVLWAF